MLRIPRTDLLAAAALLAIAGAELALGHGTAPPGVSAAAATVMSAGIALRRRAPVAGLALAVTGLGLVMAFSDISTSDDQVFPYVGLLASAYAAGAYARGRGRWVAAALALGVAPVALAAGDPDGVSFDSALFFELFVAPAFLIGLAMARHRRAERALEVKAETAVADERVRIARELHDVVAHAISVIVVQAQGGARMVRVEPEEAESAFAAIERTGGQALTEMRRLLGMLRAADERAALAPQPGVARLGALADEVRRAGLPVELEIEGDPAALPPGVDVSAYRIVQEALTNALKHAGPAHASVRVRCGADAVDVEVRDDGRGGAPNGAGHGLAGMRERVAVYGGSLEAGALAAGGFAITARLPYER
jgi:signal transduction histidine kinase